MTEPEAQALAQRLERVWGVLKSSSVFQERPDAFWFTFDGLLPPVPETQCVVPSEPETRLIVHYHEAIPSMRPWDGLTVNLRIVYEYEIKQCVLNCQTDGTMSEDRPGPQRPTDVVLALPWLPFFRRGCWLSGLPIEASAHEKAEWMRGFTKEEIEEWQLKV